MCKLLHAALTHPCSLVLEIPWRMWRVWYIPVVRDGWPQAELLSSSLSYHKQIQLLHCARWSMPQMKVYFRTCAVKGSSSSSLLHIFCQFSVSSIISTEWIMPFSLCHFLVFHVSNLRISFFTCSQAVSDTAEASGQHVISVDNLWIVMPLMNVSFLFSFVLKPGSRLLY